MPANVASAPVLLDARVYAAVGVRRNIALYWSGQIPVLLLWDYLNIFRLVPMVFALTGLVLAPLVRENSRHHSVNHMPLTPSAMSSSATELRF